MASPHAAGVAALIRQCQPGQTPGGGGGPTQVVGHAADLPDRLAGQRSPPLHRRRREHQLLRLWHGERQGGRGPLSGGH
ncbi:MAG: hypothetical protein OEW30_15725 [Acidimicrobiia bacterium]|nr:hypothetical protein [Acidimicrobiia bacterium]